MDSWAPVSPLFLGEGGGVCPALEPAAWQSRSSKQSGLLGRSFHFALSPLGYVLHHRRPRDFPLLLSPSRRRSGSWPTARSCTGSRSPSSTTTSPTAPTGASLPAEATPPSPTTRGGDNLCVRRSRETLGRGGGGCRRSHPLRVTSEGGGEAFLSPGGPQERPPPPTSSSSYARRTVTASAPSSRPPSPPPDPGSRIQYNLGGDPPR